MKVETLVVGMLEVNCYLAWDEGTGAGWVVDPGDQAGRIVARIERLQLRPQGILLTHGHVDHIRGVGGVARHFGIPVFVHDAERALYASPRNALLPWLSAATDLPDPGPVQQDLPGIGFAVIHTPGHTPGGCCFHFPAAGVLFSGDTLFQQSVGRTDLPGGNTEELLASITRKLFVLPPETAVYPGHGPPTTVADELRANPFIV